MRLDYLVPELRVLREIRPYRFPAPYRSRRLNYLRRMRSRPGVSFLSDTRSFERPRPYFLESGIPRLLTMLEVMRREKPGLFRAPAGPLTVPSGRRFPALVGDYFPSGRPVESVRSKTGTKAAEAFAVYRSPLLRVPAPVSDCVVRSSRRSVLFASGIAGVGRRGSPGKNGHYARSMESSGSCHF